MLNHFGSAFLAQFRETGGQSVAELFATHGKAGPYRPEEDLLVGDLPGALLADLQLDHRGGYLGLWEEAMGRHVKQQPRLSIILTKHRKGAVVRRSRLCGDPLGHFLLHHNGNGFKALRFQQRRQNGGSNIVGQIGTGHRPQALKLLRHKPGNILLQNVRP